MTQETIEALKPYEQQLRRAYFGNYIMPMGVAETKKLYEIYNKEFNEHETNANCGQCRYRVARRLGERYFKALDIATDPSAVTKTFGNVAPAPQEAETPNKGENKPVETPKPEKQGNTPAKKKKRK